MKLDQWNNIRAIVTFLGEFILKIYRSFESSGKYGLVAGKVRRLLFLLATSFFNSRLYLFFISHFVLTLATSFFTDDFIFHTWPLFFPIRDFFLFSFATFPSFASYFFLFPTSSLSREWKKK